MDGVNARLPVASEVREPKAQVPGLTNDLLRISSELDQADFFEITDRTKSASLSLFSHECLGRLRLLAWGDFVVLVFRRTDARHLSIGVMLKNLSQHGWKASVSLDSPEFLYRVLDRPAELVIASQIHVLLEEMDLSVNALKLGLCEDLSAQEG